MTTEPTSFVICRACDPGLVRGFADMAERGAWCGQHTRETGHHEWYCIDPWKRNPKPDDLIWVAINATQFKVTDPATVCRTGLVAAQGAIDRLRQQLYETQKALLDASFDLQYARQQYPELRSLKDD